MKEKVMGFIKGNLGDISLFAIVMAAVLIASVLTYILTADRLTRLFLSLSCGVLARMGIDSIGDAIGMRLGNSRYPSVLAVIIGGVIILF